MMLKFSFLRNRRKRRAFLAFIIPVLIILCVVFRHQLYAGYVYATLDSKARKELKNMKILLTENGQYISGEKHRYIYAIDGVGKKYKLDDTTYEYYKIPTSSPSNRSLVRRSSNKTGEHLLLNFSGDEVSTEVLNIPFFEGYISYEGSLIAQINKQNDIDIFRQDSLLNTITMKERVKDIRWMPHENRISASVRDDEEQIEKIYSIMPNGNVAFVCSIKKMGGEILT